MSIRIFFNRLLGRKCVNHRPTKKRTFKPTCIACGRDIQDYLLKKGWFCLDGKWFAPKPKPAPSHTSKALSDLIDEIESEMTGKAKNHTTPKANFGTGGGGHGFTEGYDGSF